MKGTINATLPDAENQLLTNEKEQREHYTIVDLMRNDLSMVAEHIQVKKFRYIDRIKTQKGEILQTSSEIYGKLNENWQNQIGDILEKLLPAGSISGAPKEKPHKLFNKQKNKSAVITREFLAYLMAKHYKVRWQFDLFLK